jgi:hypothetical protein
MRIDELKKIIDKDLDSQRISGRILLNRMRLIDETSRKSSAYLDHRYAPFYYYLGKYISPKSFMEIGFTIGLLSASFLASCKTVDRFFGFKEQGGDFVPQRIGRSNIRLFMKSKKDEYYSGNLFDEQFSSKILPNFWDLIIINEETVYDKHLEYLDLTWDSLSEDGYIVAEYIDRHKPAKQAFFAFCESKNRKPIVFKTRFGTGIIQR